MPEVITSRVKYPDSIEVGSATKSGQLKVYFDADDLAGAQQRIDNAVAVRQHLLTRLSQGGTVV